MLCLCGLTGTSLGPHPVTAVAFLPRSAWGVSETRVQSSSVAVHSAVSFGAGKISLSLALQVWATSGSPCLCNQLIFSSPFHFFLVLILRISSISKGKQRGTAVQGRALMELCVWSREVINCPYEPREVCAGKSGGQSAVRVCRILGASGPQPLHWESQSFSCRTEPGHSCEEPREGKGTQPLLGLGVVLAQIWKLLIVFLACAQMLQLLERHRWACQEV